MINLLKFQHKPDQKIFFFSDIHHKHNPNWPIPIWKSRGFNSSDECDETIIKRINDKVTNKDILFLLGDTVLGAGRDSEEVFNNLINKLNYQHLYIMPGNHPSGFKALFKKILNSDGKMDEFYRLSFEGIGNYPYSNHKKIYLIPNYYEIYVNRQPIVLSHYPVLSWNGMAKGSYMLFGHCHDNLNKTDWVKNNYLIGKCMDVGVDSIKEPLNFDEIKQIMNKRIDLSIDHHTQDTSSPFS